MGNTNAISAFRSCGSADFAVEINLPKLILGRDAKEGLNKRKKHVICCITSLIGNTINSQLCFIDISKNYSSFAEISNGNLAIVSMTLL